MSDNFPLHVAGIFFSVLLVAVVGVLLAFPHPSSVQNNLGGQAILLPNGAISYEEQVWISPSDTASATSAQNNANRMDVASPIWFEARSNTSITHYTSPYDQAGLQSTLQAAGVAFIPTIDHAGQLTFLDSAQGRDTQTTNVVNLVLSRGFDGIDIDYETLPYSQRQGFSDYITLLGQKLHANGKMLIVTVHPKWNDAANYTGAGAQDWAIIGQHADQVRIMLYGWDGTLPGPNSPLYWIDGVLTYAESAIPPSKIVVGLPWYGRDFVSTTSTQVGWNDVQGHIALYHPAILRDPAGARTSGEITYNYIVSSVTHTVFYPDAQSYTTKTDDIKAKHPNVAGFVNFIAGKEDPATWSVVDSLRASAPSPVPTIALTSPINGETWKVGETHTITWTVSGADSIALSLSGTPLATLPGSATSYSWTITQPAGSYTLSAVAQNSAGSATSANQLSVWWQCADSDAGSTTVIGTTTANGGPLTSATDVCGTSTECKTLGAKVTSCLKEYSCGTQGLITNALVKCSCTNGACAPQRGRK